VASVCLIWGFLFLGGLGVITLRWREANLHRPYKVALAIQIIFCIIAFGMVASSIPFTPLESGILAAFVFPPFRVPSVASPGLNRQLAPEHIRIQKSI